MVLSSGCSRMFKSNPRNSIFLWKVAFRGLLFEVLIVVVVMPLAVVVLVVVVAMLKSNPPELRFLMAGSFSGIAFFK